ARERTRATGTGPWHTSHSQCGLGRFAKVQWPSGPPPQFQNRSEASEYHPFAVERHRIALWVEPRITHDLCHGSIPRVLVRPLDPREHHHLVILCLHGTTKVSQLAVLDVITPALEDTLGAVLDEHRVPLLGVFDELLLVLPRHSNYETIDVAHLCTPVGRYQVHKSVPRAFRTRRSPGPQESRALSSMRHPPGGRALRYKPG